MPLSPLDLPLHTPRPRENRRHAQRTKAHFTVMAKGEKETWEGINLSQGGMLCAASTPLWPGATVEVTVVMRERRPVKVQAQVLELVAHDHLVAMRLQFQNVTVDQRRALMLMVHEATN